MVIVYSSVKSPRLEYIAEHIFHNILGIDYQIVTNRETFLKSGDYCINYSERDLSKGLWIQPTRLLFEKGVFSQKIKVIKDGQIPYFYAKEKGDFPFDIFAASFYLLTRYEEYFPTKEDNHGRFKIEESLASKEGFLQIPVVDRWAYQLKDALLKQNKNPDCFRLREFRMITTFDIDHPFLYKNKGITKNTLGSIKDLKDRDLKKLKERLHVFLRLKEDPYFQSLKNIVELHKQHNRPCYLFIHIGGYGKFDRRTIYPLRRYYKYLNAVKKDVYFGLHPSYVASFDEYLIRKEKLKLERIVNSKIKRNRQHFLRMKTPDTYQTLNRLNFSEDFTLTYPSQAGFRAGTAIPFHFFDLIENEKTPLLIRPTIIMDATLNSYMKLNPKEAIDLIDSLAKECKLSGGDFCLLWHNSEIANPETNPWYQVFIHSFLTGISLEK